MGDNDIEIIILSKAYFIGILIVIESEFTMSYRDFFHFCQAGVAADTIEKQLGVPAEQIYRFADDLTFGPLDDIDADAVKRAAFLEQFYDTASLQQIEIKGGLSKFLQLESAQLKIEAPRSPKPMVVWHGNNTADQLLLRRIVFQLRRQERPLFELNVPDYVKNGQTESSQAIVIDSDCADRLWTQLHPIDLARQQVLIADWQRLRKDSGMRQVSGHHITVLPLDCLDADILKLFNERWAELSTIVEKATVEADSSLISASFVKWRIRNLAAHQMIEIGTHEQVDQGRLATRAREQL